MSAPRKPLTGIEGERLTYWRTNERPEADTLG